MIFQQKHSFVIFLESLQVFDPFPFPPYILNTRENDEKVHHPLEMPVMTAKQTVCPLYVLMVCTE